MDHIERYRKRRDDRLKKRMDEEQWITIKGTHVMVDDDGQVSKGPSELKSIVNKSGGYKKETNAKYKAIPAKDLPEKPIVDRNRAEPVKKEETSEISDGPAPKPVNPYSSGEEAEKALAKGRALRDLDRDDLLKIARAYGMNTERYTKTSGMPFKNSEIAEEIISHKNKMGEKSGAEPERKPRPKTRLEVMNENKAKYEAAKKELKGMKPGLERDVKEKLILPWIEGAGWMGGLPDSRFTKLASKLPYDFDTIYNEFQKQMMKY